MYNVDKSQHVDVVKEGDTVLEEGFPYELQNVVHNVLGIISIQTYNNVSKGYTDEFNNEEYVLLDGSIITFPYRIYFIDDEITYSKLKSNEEKMIYDCIFTRSCDGYVRQKHLKRLLIDDMPEWYMPYVLKLSSEYVKEIVEDIYRFMSDKDNSLFQAFCYINTYMFRYAYSRMTSYWNEFYRKDSYRFHDYVGYKLYKQCFGYSRRFDKLN